jgi:hypothetical protein
MLRAELLGHTSSYSATIEGIRKGVSTMARAISTFVVLLCSFASAQPAQQPTQTKPPQTPRQALIEIITGGGKAIQKHLAVEIQQMISEASKKKKDAGAKSGPDMSTFALELLGMPSLAGEKDLKTFESGSVLLSYSEGNVKQRVEVRVDGDDLSGTQDELQISIHLFKDEQEQTIPFIPSITVGMKQQENVWRLNEIGASAKLAIGDPKFFEDILKLQQQSASESRLQKHSEDAAEKEEQPKLPATSVVSMLAYAESRYAQINPEVGFTCNISELANGKAGTGLLDPQVGTGVYNGYHFTIIGCDGKPAIAFHIVAEPLVAGPGSKAYCNDPTHNIRVSDDGRGSTCMASGRLMNREAPVETDGETIGVQIR